MGKKPLYLAIAGIFYGDAFTWQKFLEGWEALFAEGVFGVQIQRATYTLALRSSARVAEAARRYAAQLPAFSAKFPPVYAHGKGLQSLVGAPLLGDVRGRSGH